MEVGKKRVCLLCGISCPPAAGWKEPINLGPGMTLG